jgi:hypothetical protein
MVIALDATSSGNANGNLTVAHTIGSGLNRYLLALVFSDGSTPANSMPLGVQFNGTSMTLAVSGSESDGSNTVSAWYLADPSLPAGGTYNTIVTASPSNNRLKLLAASFTGVNGTAPEVSGTNNSNLIPVTSISTSVTTLSANDVLVDYVGAGGVGTFTATAGQTLLRAADATQSRETVGSYRTVGAAGSYATSWTFASANDLNQIVVALTTAFSAPGAYTYTFAQTADGNCDAGVLLAASAAANLASAQPTRIDTASSVITIYFNGTLSGGDKSLLDAIVAAHKGLILTTTPSPVPIDGSWTTIPMNMTASVDVSKNLILVDHFAIDGRLQLDGRLVELI